MTAEGLLRTPQKMEAIMSAAEVATVCPGCEHCACPKHPPRTSTVNLAAVAPACMFCERNALQAALAEKTAEANRLRDERDHYRPDALACHGLAAERDQLRTLVEVADALVDSFSPAEFTGGPLTEAYRTARAAVGKIDAPSATASAALGVGPPRGDMASPAADLEAVAAGLVRKERLGHFPDCYDAWTIAGVEAVLHDTEVPVIRAAILAALRAAEAAGYERGEKAMRERAVDACTWEADIRRVSALRTGGGQ